MVESRIFETKILDGDNLRDVGTSAWNCNFIWDFSMEKNILELEYSEQPISAYQAIGLIDCNISAQGSEKYWLIGHRRI